MTTSTASFTLDKSYDELHAVVRRLSSEEGLVDVVKRVWRREAKIIQPRIRNKMKWRLGGKKKLARSYTISVRGTTAKNLSMDMYSRAKPTVTLEDGGIIAPRKGQYLAIPTSNASGSVSGRRMLQSGRTAGINKRLTPRMLKDSFVKTSKKGNKIIFQRIPAADKKLKKYFLKNSGRSFAGQIVPMFVLVKRVVLRPRTNVRGAFLRETPRIADKTLDAIVKEFDT